MLQKFYLIDGVAGRLLEDPRAAGFDPRRYLGMQRKADAAEIQEHADRYAPVRMVIPRLSKDGPVVDPSVFAKGDLVLVGECTAVSMDEAMAKLTADKAPKKDGK